MQFSNPWSISGVFAILSEIETFQMLIVLEKPGSKEAFFLLPFK